ncbi:hypothetical protein AAVH_02619 [Aphelenchoides avenae]|nr:hypothetical protein AAVH_02619 [Aphelenchus avenae]
MARATEEAATYAFRIGPMTPLISKQGTKAIGEAILKLLFALNPQVPVKDIALSSDPTTAHIFVLEKDDLASFKKVCPEKVTIRIGKIYGSASVNFGKENNAEHKKKNFVRLRSRSQSVSKKATTGAKLVRAVSEYKPKENKPTEKKAKGVKVVADTDKENCPPTAPKESRPSAPTKAPLQASQSKDSGICDDDRVKNKLSVRALLSKLNQPPELGVENCAGIYPDGAPLFDSLATAKTAVYVPEEKSMKLYAKLFTDRVLYFAIDKKKRHLLEEKLLQSYKSDDHSAARHLSGASLKKNDMVLVVHRGQTNTMTCHRARVVARYPHADSATYLLYLPDYGLFTKDKVHNMTALTGEFAKAPFLAVPCMLAGLSDTQATCFTNARSKIRQALAEDTKTFGYVVGYERDFTLVQIGCKPEHEAVAENAVGTVKMLPGEERTTIANDLGATLMEDGQCVYKPPPASSCYFSRERLMAIRELVIANDVTPRIRNEATLNEIKR